MQATTITTSTAAIVASTDDHPFANSRSALLRRPTTTTMTATTTDTRRTISPSRTCCCDRFRPTGRATSSSACTATGPGWRKSAAPSRWSTMCTPEHPSPSPRTTASRWTGRSTTPRCATWIAPGLSSRKRAASRPVGTAIRTRSVCTPHSRWSVATTCRPDPSCFTGRGWSRGLLGRRHRRLLHKNHHHSGRRQARQHCGIRNNDTRWRSCTTHGPCASGG
mmetsp:Transcript_11786/g.33966  ORF Transcript_11786/g.33966 Transcript_11786/m.33966 type:complete len:222 (+) Transcript_11786:2340-3005(+)